MSPDITVWSVLDAYHTSFANGLTGTVLSDQSSSGGSVGAVAGDATHPGIAEATTSTSASGVGCALTFTSAFRFGSGDHVADFTVRIPTLATVAQDYVLRVGWIDVAAGDASDGAFFEYDRATSGDFWRYKTAAAGVRSAVASTTGIAAATWYRLTVVVNAAGTQADFYVGGALLGSHTTNLPTGAGRETGFGFHIIKTAGTTARTLECDRAMWRISLSTPR